MILMEHHYGATQGSPSTPFWRVGGEHRFGARSDVASVNNIQRLREGRGWSRPELGKLMGTSGQQIERLEKGQRKLSQEWIDKAAGAFGVAAAAIISAVEESPQEPDRAPSRDRDAGEIVQIAQLDLSLPMGTGATVEDYIEEEPRAFDLAYIRGFSRTPPHRLRIARGVGDSMWPTLQTADMVWIDSTQTSLNQADRIWAVSINGAAAIKRLRRLKLGRVLIVSDNPAVENYEVDEEDIRIGGRVIRFARDV